MMETLETLKAQHLATQGVVAERLMFAIAQRLDDYDRTLEQASQLLGTEATPGEPNPRIDGSTLPVPIDALTLFAIQIATSNYVDALERDLHTALRLLREFPKQTAQSILTTPADSEMQAFLEKHQAWG